MIYSFNKHQQVTNLCSRSKSATSVYHYAGIVKQTMHTCSWICFEDFTSLNNLSVICGLGSRRNPISEIQMVSLGFKPRNPCSVSYLCICMKVLRDDMAPHVQILGFNPDLCESMFSVLAMAKRRIFTCNTCITFLSKWLLYFTHIHRQVNEIHVSNFRGHVLK